MLAEGLKYTAELTVTESDTAIAVESGDLPVLATPRMVALMEKAAMRAAAPELGPDESTVGSYIEVTHLAPSPVGAQITATATLTAIEGHRLIFQIEARQGDTVIGRATHRRHVVLRSRFLSRL